MGVIQGLRLTAVLLETSFYAIRYGRIMEASSFIKGPDKQESSWKALKASILLNVLPSFLCICTFKPFNIDNICNLVDNICNFVDNICNNDNIYILKLIICLYVYNLLWNKQIKIYIFIYTHIYSSHL